MAKRLCLLSTLPAAAGSVVDYVVSVAMKALRDDGVIQTDFAAAGSRMMKRLVHESPLKCELLKSGSTAPGPACMPPLLHDFLGIDLGRAYEEKMMERTAECLAGFEDVIWPWLLSTNPVDWFPLLRLDHVKLPYIEIEKGLRLLTPYDMALELDGRVLILDWKTGKRNPSSEGRAKLQLAAYARWALQGCSQRTRQVRVAPVWLLHPQCVGDCLQEVTDEQMVELNQQVSSDFSREQELTLAGRGGATPQRSLEEAFPAMPSPRCMSCRWLLLCGPGMKECNHALPPQIQHATEHSAT